MSHQVVVRPATADDLQSIAALEHVLHSYEVDPSLQWHHFETSSNRVVLLALVDGAVAGMVKLNMVYKLSKAMAMLDELVVHEANRGQGVGSALMTAAEGWSWDHGADIIDFTSRESHEALGFYEKLGYQKRATNVYRKLREGYDGSR